VRKLLVGDFEFEGVFNDRTARIVIDNYDEIGISIWDIEKLIPRKGEWFAFIKAETDIPGFEGFINIAFMYKDRINNLGKVWEVEFRKSVNENGDYDVLIKTDYWSKEIHGPSYYNPYTNSPYYDLSFSESMFIPQKVLI
jgi:hypothetical protein